MWRQAEDQHHHQDHRGEREIIFCLSILQRRFQPGAVVGRKTPVFAKTSTWQGEINSILRAGRDARVSGIDAISLQNTAGSFRHGVHGVVGQVDRQAGFLGDEPVYAARISEPPPAITSPPIHKIGGEFGRTAFQCQADGFQKCSRAVLAMLRGFPRNGCSGFWAAQNQGTAAFDIQGQFLFQRKRGADTDLDFFSGAFTYHHVVGAFSCVRQSCCHSGSSPPTRRYCVAGRRCRRER